MPTSRSSGRASTTRRGRPGATLRRSDYYRCRRRSSPTDSEMQSPPAATVRREQRSKRSSASTASSLIRGEVVGDRAPADQQGQDVAALADEFQALDSLRVAAALDRRLQTLGRGIDVLVQVNTSSEGVQVRVAPRRPRRLPHRTGPFSSLRVRGLMTLAALSADAERAWLFRPAARPARPRT